MAGSGEPEAPVAVAGETEAPVAAPSETAAPIAGPAETPAPTRDEEELEEVRLSDPWQYAALAEGVEAWAFRYSQRRHEFISREEATHLWLEEEFRPVVRMLREADLIGRCTDADRDPDATPRVDRGA